MKVGFAQSEYMYLESDDSAQAHVVVIEGVIERDVFPVVVNITALPGTAQGMNVATKFNVECGILLYNFLNSLVYCLFYSLDMFL